MTLPESPPNPLAAQMAQLLVSSDLEELREIVRRWVKEAPAGPMRRQYEEFASRLVELKQALSEAPVQPTREELELALTMMLRLAVEKRT